MEDHPGHRGKREILKDFAIPLVAAIIGGFFGSWYGGHLAREQWKYDKTLDSYTSLVNVFDEAIFLSAKIPTDLRFVKHLKRAGRESEAITRAAQILDTHFPQLANLVAKARISFTVIQVLQPHRQQQTEDWLREFSAQVVHMGSLSIQAVDGDTCAHRSAQYKLESLRKEIVQANREDFSVK